MTATAMVIAGGCADTGDDQQAALPVSTSTTTTVTTLPPTTTTTEPPDPLAFPDDPADIDAAYVERVINEHNRIVGDATRMWLANGDPLEVIDRYNAVYTPHFADEFLTHFFSITEEEFALLKPSPGDVTSTVVTFDVVGMECIRVVVDESADALLLAPPEIVRAVVVLRPSVPLPTEAAGVNETGWQTEGSTPWEVEHQATC